MKTKTSMNKLRTWIAAGSFAAFVGGWALLAQSGAPATAQLPAAAITSAGTVPSQAPTATAVKAATAKPKLKTGGSR